MPKKKAANKDEQNPFDQEQIGRIEAFAAIREIHRQSAKPIPGNLKEPPGFDPVEASRFANEAEAVARLADGVVVDIPANSAKVLTKVEAVEFLKQPFNLGRPRTKQNSGAGRKSKKTQYDTAYERRRDLWRRLVINPGLRVGTGYIDREYITCLFLEFKERGVNPRHWVRAAMYRLAKDKKVVPDETELRKIKRGLMK